MSTLQWHWPILILQSCSVEAGARSSKSASGFGQTNSISFFMGRPAPFSDAAPSLNAMVQCRPKSTVESKFEISDLPGTEQPYVLHRMGSYSLSLETVQSFDISKIAILAFGINLLHNSQTLCVSEIARQGQFAIRAIFHARVIKISERPPARC